MSRSSAIHLLNRQCGMRSSLRAGERSMGTQEFYIQDTRTFTGNSVTWWRPNGQGYTTNLDKAWKVDEARAREICRTRNTDKMWPCEQIDAQAQRHFDVQDFIFLGEAGRVSGPKEGE